MCSELVLTVFSLNYSILCNIVTVKFIKVFTSYILINNSLKWAWSKIGKITNEDRDFLLHHWTKRISSTPDLPLRTAVQTKLHREEKRQAYYAEQTAALSSTPLSTAAPTSTPPNPSASPTASSPSNPTTGTPPSSDTEFKPKRPCVTPKPAGTPILLPKDILRRVGPTADRLGLSNNQLTTKLTTITAVIANHAGGELDDLSLATWSPGSDHPPSSLPPPMTSTCRHTWYLSEELLPSPSSTAASLKTPSTPSHKRSHPLLLPPTRSRNPLYLSSPQILLFLTSLDHVPPSSSPSLMSLTPSWPTLNGDRALSFSK